MAPLRDYRVINVRLLDQLARQLDLPIERVVSNETEIGPSLPFVRTGWRRTVTGPGMAPEDPRIIEKVVEGLRESGQLRIYRPESSADFDDEGPIGWYVSEQLTVTPVTVPVSAQLRGFGAPDRINVWVGDPVVPRDSHADDGFVGSFLFLVEELPEQPASHLPRPVSGMSAVRFLFDSLRHGEPIGVPANATALATESDFAPSGYLHPMRKLERAGGVAGRPRKVDTVYKIALMTNERTYTVEGRPLRMNDIAAYPLFIAQ